jgi:hypothetical protein
MLAGIRSDLKVKSLEETPSEKGVSPEVKALESGKPSNPFEAISMDMRSDARKWVTRVAVTGAADKALEKFLQLPPLKPLDESLGRVTGRVYSALAEHTAGALRYADLLGWKEVSFTPQALYAAKINPFSIQFLKNTAVENFGGFNAAEALRKEVGIVNGFNKVVVLDNLQKTIQPLETKGLFTFAGRAFVAGAALLKVLGESTQYYKQQQALEKQGNQSHGESVLKTAKHLVQQSCLGVATWEAANMGVQIAERLLFVIPNNTLAKFILKTVTTVAIGSFFSSATEVIFKKLNAS